MQRRSGSGVSIDEILCASHADPAVSGAVHAETCRVHASSRAKSFFLIAPVSATLRSSDKGQHALTLFGRN
jgi:hypothetical protein